MTFRKGCIIKLGKAATKNSDSLNTFKNNEDGKLLSMRYLYVNCNIISYTFTILMQLAFQGL